MAFSSLGAMESPSDRFGMASRSILKSVLVSEVVVDLGSTGTWASRPDFNGSMWLDLELPEKRYVMVKMNMNTSATVRLRCCLRAMVADDELLDNNV